MACFVRSQFLTCGRYGVFDARAIEEEFATSGAYDALATASAAFSTSAANFAAVFVAFAAPAWTPPPPTTGPSPPPLFSTALRPSCGECRGRWVERRQWWS